MDLRKCAWCLDSISTFFETITETVAENLLIWLFGPKPSVNPRLTVL